MSMSFGSERSRIAALAPTIIFAPAGRPGVEQQHGQLPGGLALSSRVDAEISAACRQGFNVEAGSSFEVSGRDGGIPPRGEAGLMSVMDPRRREPTEDESCSWPSGLSTSGLA